MYMYRWIKKLFVLMAIVFMAVQPVFIPTVYAVQSWTGDPWEGESWEGDQWDGSDLKWEGETWEGDSWTGDSWNGNGTNSSGSPTDQDWTGVPWYLEGWSQSGTNGSPWSGNGFNGNGTAGSPWTQPGFNYGPGVAGNPWSGNVTSGNGTSGSPWIQPGYDYGPGGLVTPWLMPGYNGNGTEGASFDGNGTNGNGTEGDPASLEDFPTFPFEYDVGKYVVNDVMMGQVNLVGDLLTSQNMRDLGYESSMNYGLGYRGNLLMNGLKLGVGDNVVFDAYDTYSHVEEGVGAIQDFRAAQQFYNTSSSVGDLAEAGRSVSNATPPATSVGALSKFNVATAAVGTGISAFETGYNSARAVDVLNSDASGADKTVAVTDATASFGDTLMNAGVVTSAIPGAQAVGAGMVAVGAGVWAVSKGVRFVASHWKGNWKDTGKAMWKSTKDTAKKAWDTVTGWFS
ncbi:hypothetical protein SAMN05216238_10665 [Lentibacillus persicus]|uniref:Uncharacterized protein n=1 Tax=Lentibacillus persicus TaxID=640948 RepID=A0A1I1WN60_9BACI|nr:hypothetical protein [Lentibacillus persicus]SFD94520.1 hypothetical protein SAMN05216238_10665 [Lentibacillus persicus]